MAKRKASPCQQDDNNQADGGTTRLNLPEDILRHIHSVMPIRDAARAACVSHAFLQSWICYPNLTFNKEKLRMEEEHGDSDSEDSDSEDDEVYLIDKINHILEKHSGIGVKRLELNLCSCYNIDFLSVDNWLCSAVKPGIEEVTLIMPDIFTMKREYEATYSFPCSVLSDGCRDSMRYIYLMSCAFRPTVDIGVWRSLTKLHLSTVGITGDELECLLSNSFALEWLKLMYCNEIVSLKIPSLLWQLNFICLIECNELQVLECNAPNVCTVELSGVIAKTISLGNSLQVKNLRMICLHQYNTVCYARTKLLPIVPYVETLTIGSPSETVNTPMLPSKFLHLKYLNICFIGLALSPHYDYMSLVSFLDASPCLETFVLNVTQRRLRHASILAETPHLRQILEHHHGNLKRVEMTGFYSEKSLVELTCHILEMTASLDCLTLDTTLGGERCSTSRGGYCCPLYKELHVEALNALLAIKRFIVGKVPSTVKLHVVEPCSRCHTELS